jgi:hypothetical protein
MRIMGSSGVHSLRASMGSPPQNPAENRRSSRRVQSEIG